MPVAGVGVPEELFRVIVALLAGMLIGVERERARLSARRARAAGEEVLVKEFPGLRTFSLISLYGCVAGLAFSLGLVGAAAFTVLIAVFGLVVGVFSAQRLLLARAAGVTTIVVMLVDFTIGLLAGLGEVLLAAALAVLTTFVLAIKIPAEKVVGRIRYEELLWGLELGVVIVVVGPFFLATNITVAGIPLRGIYLFFALVLTTSYAGYVLVRLRGAQGTAYLALLGGVANSEATLVSCLEMMDEESRAKFSPHLAVVTNAAMLLRNLVIAFGAAYTSLGAASALQAVVPLVLASLAALTPTPFSWHILTGQALRSVVVRIANPLSFGMAAKSTLMYLAIAFTSSAVSYYYGGEMLSIVALAGGFVSSSATILALFTSGIPAAEAAKLAVYATIASLANKPLYAYIASGSGRVTARTALASTLQALLASIALFPQLV